MFKIEIWDIDRVIPYDRNVKVHNHEQVMKIANSIKEFGFDQPLVVDKNGVLIKGHGRRLAALELGFKQVPVVVRDDLTEDQVKAARLADNRVAIGDIDTMLLQDEIKKIDMELDGFFDAKELEFLNANLLEVNENSLLNTISNMEEETKSLIDGFHEEAPKEVKITDLLGFKTVTVDQQQPIVEFICLAEDIYKTKGAEAFVMAARDFVARECEEYEIIGDE